MTAFSYGFKSPRSSSQKPTQAWRFCSAQGCCAARGSFDIFHQAVILRFAHGTQTGRKIFPPSYLAPNKESAHLYRARWVKIPKWGHLKSRRRTALAPKPLRVRNKPSASRSRGHADKNRLTSSGVLVSKRSTCKVVCFFCNFSFKQRKV